MSVLFCVRDDLSTFYQHPPDMLIITSEGGVIRGGYYIIYRCSFTTTLALSI